MLLTCANDATFVEYVATLAHVVYAREHKFDVTLIEYLVKFAHTPKNNNLKQWKPIAFAQKDISHGGTNENRWKWARSFQWRQNASITSSILEELPKCLWQS